MQEIDDVKFIFSIKGLISNYKLVSINGKEKISCVLIDYKSQKYIECVFWNLDTIFTEDCYYILKNITL